MWPTTRGLKNTASIVLVLLYSSIVSLTHSRLGEDVNYSSWEMIILLTWCFSGHHPCTCALPVRPQDGLPSGSIPAPWARARPQWSFVLSLNHHQAAFILTIFHSTGELFYQVQVLFSYSSLTLTNSCSQNKIWGLRANIIIVNVQKLAAFARCSRMFI